MTLLKKYGDTLIRFLLKLKAQKTITRLSKKSEASQKMVVDALKGALENDITQEEKVWVNKIELLRKN